MATVAVAVAPRLTGDVTEVKRTVGGGGLGIGVGEGVGLAVGVGTTVGVGVEGGPGVAAGVEPFVPLGVGDKIVPTDGDDTTD